MHKTILLYLIPIIIISFIFSIKDIVLPFALSILFSYALYPLIHVLNRKFNHTISVLLVLVTFIFIALFFLLIALPIAFSQFTDLIMRLPHYFNKLLSLCKELLYDVQNSEDHPLSHVISPSTEVNMAIIEDNILHFSTITLKVVKQIINTIFDSGMSIIQVFTLILLTPVLTFYISRDWEIMINNIDDAIPPHYNNFKVQFYAILDTISSYIKGQSIICLILAITYSIALSILSIPYGFIIGFLTGILNFFPYIGVLFGFSLSILLSFLHFSSTDIMIYVTAVFVIIQLIEGYYLTPKLIGESVGLHPVWIIFSILAGGSLLGMIGVLIAIPMAAIIKLFLSNYIKYIHNKNITLS